MTVQPYVPDAANWVNAFESGQKARMVSEKSAAQKTYGAKFMTDPNAAAASIAGYDPNLALETAKYGQGVKSQARLKTVNDLLGKGDYQGALAATEGDQEGHKLVVTHIAETADAMATGAQSLKGLPPEQAQQKYLTEVLPRLHALGHAGPGVDDFQATPENIAQVETAALGLKDSLGLNRQASVDAETARHNKATEAAPKFMAVPAGGTLERIDPGRGAPSPVALAAAPAADPAHAVDGLAAATGATITSGARTPEHNAAVGGVPTSHHLTDTARDLVPPAGMTLAQLGAEVQAKVPGAKVLVENDHVHVQWDGGHAPTAGALPDTIKGPAKADADKARPATAEEKASYGIAADVPAQMLPNGEIRVVSGTGAGNKRVPAKIQQGYADNAKGMNQIDAAIAAIKSNPHALGLKNKVGDDIMQRLDAEGVPVRASVANIGSLLIHDRSGAAVTAAEQPRLMPFIPQVSDTPDAAIRKLQLLKEQYQMSNDQIETQFGEESGYTPLGHAEPAHQAQPAAAPAHAAPAAAPKVIRYDAHGNRL